MRKAGRNSGFLIIGAGLGAGAFILWDEMEPRAQAADPASAATRVFYVSCRDAFQDGKANIRSGEPGYRAQLDADRDGFACEPYAGPRR
jgi:Excalibur calcium-binding domain